MKPYVADRLHAAGAVRQARAVPARVAARAPYDEIYTGWAYPPKDYAKWAELVYQWAKHCVERYGQAEVETWYWEVWNEPNIGYWQGTPRGVPQAARLRDRRRAPGAAHGAGRRPGHRGRPAARSCATSSSTACAARTTRPARRARRSTSSPSTPRARPTFVDGHVRMGIANQLADDRRRLRRRRLVPGAEGQADRHRRVRPRRLRRLPGAAARLPQRHDVLELHRRQLRPQARPGRAKHGVNLEGALTWAFEFEDQPLLRRLPRAGDQRHRPAGAQRLPHVRPDGRPSAWPSESTRATPGSTRS